jgi:glycerol-3-phosphate dehydrogenase (NAD(P)+)
VARTTVFGAGAMGTAIAMHLARSGNDTVLWASEHDLRVLPDLVEGRKHPALPEFLPDALKVMGPDQLAAAGEGLDLAVMGAHSGGARTLARIVMDGCGPPPVVIGVAKGLEPNTGTRISEVYSAEVGHHRVVAMGGPCLAPEVAQGLPSAAVMACVDPAALEMAAGAFRSRAFSVWSTDDVVGLEHCTVAKNVGAVGMGILDGLGKVSSSGYRNAKAALFAQAVGELVELVVALGGRTETAHGLAGLGDMLVTSLGGRNRLYGELIGEGADPATALADLVNRGMTVEGVESALAVRRLGAELGLDLPFHAQVHAILFEGAPPTAILSCMKGRTA